MNVSDIVRMEIMSGILERMSDEDKRDYILLTSGNDTRDKVLNAINAQDTKLDEIIKRSSWSKSFLSDVGANVLTNGVFLIISKLLK